VELRTAWGAGLLAAQENLYEASKKQEEAGKDPRNSGRNGWYHHTLQPSKDKVSRRENMTGLKGGHQKTGLGAGVFGRGKRKCGFRPERERAIRDRDVDQRPLRKNGEEKNREHGVV